MHVSTLTFRGRHGFALQAMGAAPGRVLDVGNLGDGASSCNVLREYVQKHGGEYCGLDSNAPLTQKLNLPNQTVGDLHAAPFPDNHFDFIYAGEIIEHTWEPAKMISECVRILKPGGSLILDTPNPYSILSILQYVLRRESTMGDNRWLTYQEAAANYASLAGKGELLLQPQHKIFFTPAMMQQLLETHGCVVTQMGTTYKPRNAIHALLLKLFPHTGPHLCVVARKATLQEAFADVSTPSA